MAGKLTDQHKDEIFRLVASGKGATEVAQILGDGATGEGGEALAPIVVDESAIRYHAKTSDGQAAIRAHRERLFADVRMEPLAWAAHRVSELGEMFRHAKGLALEHSDTRAGVVEGQRWMRLAVSAADSIRAELAGVAPKDPAKHAHLHLHAEQASELTAVLGARLAELGRAGLLDDVAALLGAGNGDAPIDVTPAEASPGVDR